MYFATKYNHPRLVELLLAHGVDINKAKKCIAGHKTAPRNTHSKHCQMTALTNQFIIHNIREQKKGAKPKLVLIHQPSKTGENISER